ncbi:NAD(P)-dependent alcohol dehydrogenase [Phytohabitans sp. ZYX-F-186]|uniref:NAD(P)-dependent alcohol dehydrogenase n=1 Tax=Phytohabitans maris TaxID=3071409 RepID=A0ABU0ZC11_9ACTN|nr:NAD(P)-dependent alcohol dehydrogenase [Phytohabitans sp. ZYX-F-186]MDQ7903969.1 NAD(P)-dependent alcohol dehydrogenase [Phytohabitans sp. ZYX-F-186]
MRAVVRESYCDPDALQVCETEMPAPVAGEVLVRVRAAAVDHGTWHTITGLPFAARIVTGLRRPRVPVPGLDFAGEVAAVGAGVTRFRPGDEVFGSSEGALAEYLRAPVDRLAAKPPGISYAQAAAIPVSGCTAVQALRAVSVQRGQSVFVLGAGGGVGTFAVQLASAAGAHVTGVCGPAKAELVRKLGADEVVDYTRGDALGGARRWDAIVDTAGGRPLRRLRRALAPQGTLVIVGAEPAGGSGGGRILQGTQRQLAAMALSPFTRQRLVPLLSKVTPADLESLRAMAADGSLTPVVDRTFPLVEVPAAIRYLRAGHATGKVVVTI